MPIITPRNLRKRKFEQLRPYTAERIHAKSQGIPVEVDKEVLRKENNTLETYGGYVEDETDLLFVEDDIEEPQEFRRRNDVEEPQEFRRRRSEQESYRNVEITPALPNKPNLLRNVIYQNIDPFITTLRKQNAPQHQYVPYSDDVYQEGSESDNDDNITVISIEGDLSNETEFSSNHHVSDSSEESITSDECEVYGDTFSILSDESIESNSRDEYDLISSDCETTVNNISSNVISQRASISSRSLQSSQLRPPRQNLISKKLKSLLQWADTTPVISPNDKNFPIEKYLELFEELHKNIYVGNPWPEQARSLIRDLMMYWAGWRPNNNGINNCYKILVKLIEVVPVNAHDVPDITTLTQRYLDLTLQLLGRIIDDTPIEHIKEFISKFNKHTRVLINNLRCKGVQDKANENITVAICSVIALVNKKPMSEYIFNRFAYISKRNQEWIIKSLMLLNQTLKMLTSYGTSSKQTLLDLFELLKRKFRDEKMDPEVKIKAKECLETVKAI
ncbi:unnamed protein product [Rhizophagus irregularis]|uniref:Uncharacterized protein n=3 Tax=Rhizophagus irregularis TaxID=588596 RepID=A0A915YN25_9GLOM|nr:hypothetical protein GLOIN_2v1617642 [Rhizophagus irregularis DAOM 181602=DAOM 197198]EXX74767.1 hypothetical protein RirG_048080 [Rhizophagus irregularis DAOM 197198w]UZO25907.1 hypothetical protein OCT59_018162 [Rhizophagus irregularis]POG70245.1 hypothetical protein GLOIN_2v1617642 [Rhizophagus irregularis DAOM 181602=DAOM 197198]CAB4394054.1 unnamed protein product [Rhizophagus irregularis]CAB4429523.1 unnamed protein product [Rhizophagus irregularis]|eukprot:XP_025177111.1 hypothetical protein GLOIN_2v1617642 [Rhizophagus irregularis DAOM 181602=DAOM 197198]